MKKFSNNNKGQISIFFATTILVVISFIAFIINIGIFVKAKINLQNAVDAAAYAGASVQARQLTNIAYLNWEMRNVYKEWMFKYYVLGNLNIEDVAYGASGTTDFTMSSFALGTTTAQDNYNFPSICLDFTGSGGVSVCTNYIISGLPVFEPSAIAGGISETMNTMLDTLIDAKSTDCAERSNLNYRIATVWAYNVKTTDPSLLQLSAPEVASHLPGAFPKAFELSIRMRNLEAQVNRAPYSGVCFKTNSMNKNFCSQEVEAIIGSDRSPSNERITKAFYSGFRNLGSAEDTEMRASFTLTEIPPNVYRTESSQSLSNLLIPPSSKAMNKYYLDLKIMTLNLATFFTQFTQSTGDVVVNGVHAKTAGQCSATKTGLPVPGYPIGFAKNPDVLTYYAVKGQAKFIGLFNPFQISKTGGINLTAFAAAKPFGGRIGPRLFKTGDSITSVVMPRDASTGKFVSSAYISGIDISQLKDQYGEDADPEVYSPGAPLPLSIDGKPFWQSNPNEPVGGWIDQGSIVFSIPNLVYDYPNDALGTDQSYFADEQNHLLNTSNPQGAKAGLYNADMFEKFANLLNNRGGNVTPDDIDDAIKKVRAPTRYDANNYLIPTTETLNSQLAVDSFGVIANGPTPWTNKDYVEHKFVIYGPLYSDHSDSLYKTTGEVIGVLQNYLGYQEVAIQKYIHSMNTAASQIYLDPRNTSATTGNNLALQSAQMISDIGISYLAGQPTSDDAKPTCKSMAGKFAYFYLGAQKAGDYMDISNCTDNESTLIGLMTTYFSENEKELGEYYHTTFTLPLNKKIQTQLFSAYRPGAGNDAPSNDGRFRNVLRNTQVNMWRNFYSTKFVTLQSLLPSPKEASASYTKGSFTIFSEGNSFIMGDISQKQIINALNIESINVELKNIQH